MLAGLVSQAGAYVPTHSDPWIPNFVDSATFRSACQGTCFWDSAASWSEGRVPTASDRVIVDPGDEVMIRNTQATAEVVAVDVGGKLSFSPNHDTNLGVVTLLVLGEFEMGTSAQPISASVTAGVTFLDVSIDLSEDPGQYGNGMLALNSAKVRVHGATLSETFLRLSREPFAGDNTLVLERAPSGWRVGDALVVPDTRQIQDNEKPGDGNYVPQWEELTIADINGNVITLAAPLQFDHLGARDGDGNLDFLPHVMNRSRNVVFRSANPDGTRGHTLFHGRSDVDIRYASFQHLGRTHNAVLDSTTFDDTGKATHVGTNQIARYAIHTHHLVGPTTPQSNGYQYTLLGNSVDNGTPQHNFKWAIAIHGSHYGLISQNTIYNVAGAAIVTEDGTESYNVFERNFVVRAISRGTESRYSLEGQLHTAREATGFWFRGPLNYVRDNVAANIVQYGKALTGYGYKYLMRQLKTQTIPAFQGAMPMVDGTSVNMNQVPILEFDGNEAYGAIEGGLTYWWVGANSNQTWDVSGTTVIKDFRVWHAFNIGIYAYQSNQVTVDGLVIRGTDPALSACCTIGFHPGDYVQKDLLIKNADIQGMRIGIDLPEYGEGLATVEDSYLRNYVDNVRVRTHFSSIAGLDFPVKSAVIRNTQFDSWGDNTTHIDMRYRPRSNSNVVQTDDVYIYSYNGVVGDDFRVQYLEQAPDFIVPQTGSREGLTGSPDAGLTNQQNWDRHGIAIAGSLATTTATRPGIHGLVGQLGNGNLPAPQPDLLSITEDTTPGFIRGNVLGNDVDADGDELFVTQVNGLSGVVGVSARYNYGDFVVDRDGDYVYTLDNRLPVVNNMSDDETLTEEFTYTVSDGVNVSTTHITVEIRGVDDALPPMAHNDTAVLREDSTLIAVGNLLANDIDPDGETLLIEVVNGRRVSAGTIVDGTYGKLEIEVNGAFVYRLDNTHPAFDGLGSSDELIEIFDYTVSDGVARDQGALTIRIKGVDDNHPPTTRDDLASVIEDEPVAIAAGSVLVNDHDPDGDVLFVLRVENSTANVGQRVAGQYGTLTLNRNGLYLYELDNSNPAVGALIDGQSLIEQFVFTVSDGRHSRVSFLVITIDGRGRVGDVNADGLFDAFDLLTVFQAGEYEDEIVQNSTFGEGDWNGDGDFDSNDLVFALQQGAYGSAPAVDRVMREF